MSNDDHSTVIFSMPFFLFMCNVGMCASFSILLRFVIMASLGEEAATHSLISKSMRLAEVPDHGT